MMRWPRDNQADLIAFYGNPGSSGANGVSAQLVTVHPPFQMYYDGHPLKGISFHRKAAPALMAALNEIWDHYGQDQKKLDALGISKCAGTYNPRKVRGSATKWSNHAFGAAIDINAEENGFNAKSTIPQPVIDAFKRQGFRWGGDYKTRKDPMHFEACDGGEIASATAAMPVGIVSMPHADARPDTDNDPFDTDTAPTQPPATTTVVTARTAAAAATTAVAGGQVIASAIGGASDLAEKTTQVIDQSNQVITTSKQLVAIPKPGFWYGVLHFVTTPEFVVSAVVLIAVAWAVVWFIQKQHKPPEG